MAFVVVRDTFDVAETHRQHRLGTLERLALTLLVHTDDQGVVGRAQIEADDVAQLLDEERIVRQLEAFGAVRLQPEELEVALDTALGNAGLGSHGAHAPMGGTVGRLGVQRRPDQLGHALVIDRARLAWADIVVEAGNAALNEARAPLAHRGIGELESLRDRIVGFAVSAAQNNASPVAEGRRQRATSRKRLQLRPLVVGQHKFGLRPAHRHVDISTRKIPHEHARLMPVIYGT